MRYRILLAGAALGRDNVMIYMTGTLAQAKWRARTEAHRLLRVDETGSEIDVYENVVINIFEADTDQQYAPPVAIKGPHGQKWIDVIGIRRPPPAK
jgi:hypothetical protein